MLSLLQPLRAEHYFVDANAGGDAFSQHHILLRDNLTTTKQIKAKLLEDF